MHYITSDEELVAFVERAKGCRLLAIDTEFLRERTYHPRLCLLQLGTEDEVVLVDPFEVRDLHPVAALLQRESLMKVLHAGNQDIEILYKEVGVLPHPVFDTQIAAALLGYPQQIGYGPLVNAECGVALDKLDSFTDWTQRPLSGSQLRYAADDVIYLPRLYRQMRARLEESGRLQWLDADFESLVDPARYDSAPRERFRKLKKAGQLSRRQLAAAREVAAWREERAEAIDIPRKWVLTDEQIVEACKRETRTIDQLFMVRGMREKLSTSEARKVVALIGRGLDLPREEWPSLGRKSRNERNVDVEVDMMMALVRLRARENDIAFPTLANHESLQAIARGHYDDADLLRGWKRDIVGNELLELLEGKVSLSMEKGRMKVTHHPDAPGEPQS